MAKQLTLALGFLISPLASLMLVVPIAGFLFSSQDLQIAREVVVVVGIFYPFMLLTALLIGFPLYVVLDQIKVVNFFSALVAGGLIGALVAFGIFFTVRTPLKELLSVLLAFSMLGALNSICFYGFVRLSRRFESRP